MTNPRNATSTPMGRTYRWAGETFDSVTTILGGGVPKPALKAWGEKMVATAAVTKRELWDGMSTEEAIDFLKRAPFRDTEAAAIKGTTVHEWAEQYALGSLVTLESLPEAQQGYGRSFIRFIADFQPTWEMSEASVYSREHGYAGTLDALLRISTMGDGLGLVDYKTTRSGIFPETALQLAAYRHAEFVGLPDGTELAMPPVDWCAALWLTPTGYHLIPVDAGPLAFEYFLAAQRVRDFTTTVGKTLLRAELVPATVEEVA